MSAAVSGPLAWEDTAPVRGGGVHGAGAGAGRSADGGAGAGAETGAECVAAFDAASRSGAASLEVLSEAEWRARAEAHAARADAFTAGWRERRPRQTPHPIEDFLFTYYPTKPTKLRVWHPGAGVALEGASERAEWRGYRADDGAAAEAAAGVGANVGVGVGVGASATGRAEAGAGAGAGADAGASAGAGAGPDPVTAGGASSGADVSADRGEAASHTRVTVDPAAVLERDSVQIGWIEGLLRRTLDREARFGCFGLHEWAMVYRQRGDELRHQSLPLRLGHEGTDAVVESHDISCTHFDAYRFFTPEAEPRNRLRPTRANQPDLEQSGCLHAGMDLYKWALRLGALVPGELLLDAFALAWDIRELDMRASPYDVSAYGLEAVAIETPAGKRAYARAQRGFAERGDAIRRRLLGAIERAHGVAARTATPREAAAHEPAARDTSASNS